LERGRKKKKPHLWADLFIYLFLINDLKLVGQWAFKNKTTPLDTIESPIDWPVILIQDFFVGCG